MRADLPPGLQAAQAVHAGLQFQAEHPQAVLSWLHDSNYLVVVSVPDEAALLALDKRAEQRGIPRTTVREPDLDDEMTAVTLAPVPEARRLCANLPAALRVREGCPV